MLDVTFTHKRTGVTMVWRTFTLDAARARNEAVQAAAQRLSINAMSLLRWNTVTVSRVEGGA